MTRKQYGLKFDEADMARWDALAKDAGLTRTAFIEQTMTMGIIAAEVSGACGIAAPPLTHHEENEKAKRIKRGKAILDGQFKDLPKIAPRPLPGETPLDARRRTG